MGTFRDQMFQGPALEHGVCTPGEGVHRSPGPGEAETPPPREASGPQKLCILGSRLATASARSQPQPAAEVLREH